MKTLIILLSLMSFSAFAQTVDVKNAAASDEDTTIQIKKGGGSIANPVRYEIVNSEEEVVGESTPLLKEARDKWQTACTKWKKETKDPNKDIQIITLDCGPMDCSTVAMESTCRSKGQRKFRVKVSE